MTTKAQITAENNELREQLTDAQKDSVQDASLRRLSTALLDRVSRMQSKIGDERDELEVKLEKLHTLYLSVDGVDDLVIEYEES
jgi:hypothetical protein